MIIDKDARLFGKINIIDALIILALIGALGIAGFMFIKDTPVVLATETKTFIVKFYVPEVENFRVDAMKVDDNLYDDSKNIFLGKITNLDAQPAAIFNADAQGNTVKSDKEGYSSLEITTELTATAFENGILINNNRYGVGHSLTIRAGKSFIYLRISGIEEK